MSNAMRLFLPAVTAVSLTLVAAVSLARGEEVIAGDLAIVQAWARATPPGAELGAVYVTVENRGAAEDRLLGGSSPVAQTTTLHQSVEENGVALMRPLQEAPIPAGGALEMQPGGTHLMLMGLSAPLSEGATIPLRMDFQVAGAVELSVPVLAIGADGPIAGHHHHAP